MAVKKDILTIPEAAKYCATDRTTMWRWVKTGNLIKKDSNLSHLKILVLTGYDSEENKKKTMKAGADCFLVKPADEKKLLQNIEGL